MLSMRVGPSSQRRSSLPRAAPVHHWHRRCRAAVAGSCRWSHSEALGVHFSCRPALQASAPARAFAPSRRLPEASLCCGWLRSAQASHPSLWYALKVIPDSPDTLAARCACWLLQFYTFRTLRGALRRDGASCVSRVCIRCGPPRHQNVFEVAIWMHEMTLKCACEFLPPLGRLMTHGNRTTTCRK